MASYFGEVVESSSRAYDGNCEDVSSLNDPFIISSEYELSWISGDGPAETDLFIVTDGKCAVGFSTFLRSNATVVAKITELYQKNDEDEPPLWKKPELPSLIYKLKNGVYLCEVSPDVKVVNANYFSAKLHGLLKKSKEVVILVSKTSYGYVSSRRYSPPFVRGLSNTRFIESGGKLLAPVMDTANIITGVPASVLTWCAMKKIVASLYVCYTPKDEIDSVVCRILVQLISKIPTMGSLMDGIHFVTKEKDISNKTGNLYL